MRHSGVLALAVGALCGAGAVAAASAAMPPANATACGAKNLRAAWCLLPMALAGMESAVNLASTATPPACKPRPRRAPQVAGSLPPPAPRPAPAYPEECGTAGAPCCPYPFRIWFGEGEMPPICEKGSYCGVDGTRVANAPDCGKKGAPCCAEYVYHDWFRCEGGLYCKAPDKEAGDVGTCRRCPPNPPQEHWVHTCDPAVQWTPEEMNRPHAAAPQAEGAP
ncbi:hypothetical protein C2E20_0209 isoform B [Micractinium conductrix]|uniref:Uncharacterized protein n=1 Tax=Micractinium conductrix TaxID=554055 RepID=A0A2P6VSE0_9CHLO|nr:hypothetical protein C2E20_0209 isoform B [Micractinium conductrix]|eukprot:PSC77013.1 hypothetical protein C2E20_0209 isoform B [Micractinium conductrix]